LAISTAACSSELEVATRDLPKTTSPQPNPGTSGADAGGAAGASSGMPSGGASDNPCGVRVVAHRGDSADYPENTLLAFQRALEYGAQILEVDVRLTSDGVPYVLIDDTLDRTTNRKGSSSSIASSELSSIDAGSWKGPEFAGEHPPLLSEVVALAQSFDARVYLDPKQEAIAAMKATLAANQYPEERVFIGGQTLADLSALHDAMPAAKLVWWGDTFPDELNANPAGADAWVASLAAVGVVSFEPQFGEVTRSPALSAVRDAAHARGLELWTYWIDRADDVAAAISQYRVESIETNIVAGLRNLACGEAAMGPGQVLGDFHFDGTFAARSGAAELAPWGDDTEHTSWVYPTTLNVPALDAGARVLHVPAFDPTHAVKLSAALASAADFTIIYDVLRPAAARAQWSPLIQTDLTNKNDAELYIKAGEDGIGINQQYAGTVGDGAWHRVVAAFDHDGSTSRMRLYVDGDPAGSHEDAMERFSWNAAGALLFADDNGETSELLVANLQLRNYALRDSEALWLSRSGPGGIPTTILPAIKPR
jgi:glycerophosphoryl diester phosphodiesterase